MPLHIPNCRWEPCCQMVMVILRKGCAHFYCAHQSSSSKIPIQGVKMRWYPQQGRWSKKYINLGTIHETVLNQSCRFWNGWSFAYEGLAKNLADRISRSLCPCLFLSTHLSVLLFCLRLFLCLFVTHLFVCPSLCLFFCLSVCSSVSLSVLLSHCLFFCLPFVGLCSVPLFLLLSFCSFASFFLS